MTIRRITDQLQRQVRIAANADIAILGTRFAFAAFAGLLFYLTVRAALR